jgi:predicted nucleic-acid-binding Zn-ribbon protein
MSEVIRLCPKCRGVMNRCRALGSYDRFGVRLTEVFLISHDIKRIHIHVYSCRQCGFTEIYGAKHEPLRSFRNEKET